MNTLKTPIFIFACCIAILVAGAGTTHAWSLFGTSSSLTQSNSNSNTYVSTSQLNDIAVDTTLYGMQIGNSSFVSSYGISQATQLIQQMGDQIDMDIFSLLDNSGDKDGALTHFLASANSNILAANAISQDMKTKYQNYQKISSTCQNDKTAADKQFYDGLKKNDSSAILESYSLSKEKGSCYMENRIEANVYKLLADKLDIASKTLNQKTTLLNTNKSLIVDNYQLFKSNTLEQLLKVKNSFSNFNPDTSLFQ